jgi:integral membrane sensor domain MASE1
MYHVFRHQTLGFDLLGGVEVLALNVTGLVINTFGGLWYSIWMPQLLAAMPLYGCPNYLLLCPYMDASLIVGHHGHGTTTPP